MKKLLKAGYVSIELIIVVGIVLVAGIFGLTKFIDSGKAATTQSNDAISKALSASAVGA